MRVKCTQLFLFHISKKGRNEERHTVFNSPNHITMLKMKEDELVVAFNTLARGEHCIHIRRKDLRKGHLGELDVYGNAFEV